MTVGPHRYLSAGLILESAFDLPSLVGIAGNEAPAHLRFLRRAAPLEDPVPECGWRHEGDVFDFRAPQIAQFRIRKGGIVEVFPETENDRHIAAYLVGTVLGIALHLRGVVVLHASAVLMDDGAALFCGASGAGKSTMAAALGQRGHPVLSDDISAIDWRGGAPALHADGRKLKLWDTAVAALGLQGREGARVHDDFAKYYVDYAEARPGAIPVRALYVLADGPGPRIEPLTASEAAAAIRDNAYRAFLVQEFKDEALYFEAAAQLLRHARVFRLERPRDFGALGESLDLLQDHWCVFASERS